MIKVTRKGVNINIEYINDLNQSEGMATAFCKDVKSAKELTATIRKAISMDYGFAKCRALLEGDTLDINRGGKRVGAGRPVGTTKPQTVIYYARVSPAEKELLEIYLQTLRSGKND